MAFFYSQASNLVGRTAAATFSDTRVDAESLLTFRLTMAFRFAVR
jgi:hypothetical protein